MIRHEEFEAICAAASIGQASDIELAELRQHLVSCADCRHTYTEFLQLNAARHATVAQDQEITGDEAIACIDSTLFRERFLKKAEQQGIVFSHGKGQATLPVPQTWARAARSRWLSVGLPAAASVLLACGAWGGYYFGVRHVHQPLPGEVLSKASLSNTAPVATPVNAAASDAREQAIARLEAENQRLTSLITALKSSLAEANSTVGQLQTAHAATEKDRAQERDSALTAALTSVNGKQAEIDDLQRRLDKAQSEAAGVRAELEKAQATFVTAHADDQSKIQELAEHLAEQSNSLDREKDLLAAGRDIRELIAARNLHIADVFDTDVKGKTRPAFGRMFFTEGKSLIFYAYDLNDQRVQDAGYHYRVWGKKEGPGQPARNLGIFFSDDKSQRRWVFQYNDPKVLSEIDSVFVTLEPPGKNLSQPKGDKFLYAYLRNEANHP